MQLPKLMELVGLGYTSWFVYRYLLFKVCLQPVHGNSCAQPLLDLRLSLAGACACMLTPVVVARAHRDRARAARWTLAATARIAAHASVCMPREPWSSAENM